MSNKGVGGRRPLYETDPALIKRLIEALKAGNYIDTACDYAGINQNTYYRWTKAGRNEADRIARGEEPDPDKAAFLDLAEQIQQARAEATVRNVMLIQTAARNGTWQAAAWWLERTQPAKYGRRLQTEVSGPDGGPVAVDVSVSPEALADRIASLLGEGDAGEDTE